MPESEVIGTPQLTEAITAPESAETPTTSTIDPIYKHKDGRIFTKQQLLKEGVDDNRIKDGLSKGMITLVGDTDDPQQQFKHKDGRIISVADFTADGIGKDRIAKGIEMGMIIPIEKKNQIPSVSDVSSKDLQAGALPSTTPTNKNQEIPIVDLTPPGEEKPKKGEIIIGETQTIPQKDETKLTGLQAPKQELYMKDGVVVDNTILKEFEDFPKGAEQLEVKRETGEIDRPYSRENLLKLRDEDYGAYKSKMNAIKNQFAIREKAGTSKGNEYAKFQLQDLTGDSYQDVSNFIYLKNKQKEIVNETLSGDDRQKALDRINEDEANQVERSFTPKTAKEYISKKFKQEYGDVDLDAMSLDEVKNKIGNDVVNRAIFSKYEQFVNPKSLEEGVDNDNADKGSRLGYIGNSFLNGIGSISSGASDLMMQLLSATLPEKAIGGEGTPEQKREQALAQWRQQAEPTIREAISQLYGAEVGDNKQRQYEKEFWTSAFGGLSASIPMMVSPYGTGLFLGSYDAGLQSIENTEQAKNLPESTKTIFAVGVGTAGALLEKLGLDKIFGKQTKKIAINLTTKTLTDLMAKSSAPITAKAFEVALRNSAKTLKDKVINAGGKIAKGAAVEFLTGSAQEGVNVVAENIVNASQKKQVFDPQSMGDVAGRIFYSGLQEGVGGGIFGTISAFTSKTRNYISEKVAEAKTQQDIDNLRKEVLDQAQKNKIGKAEIDQLNNIIDQYVQINAKIPADIPNRKEVINKVSERDELKNQIEEKKQELQNADDAFKADIQKELNSLQGRYDEMNEEISSASKVGEETTITTEEVTPKAEGELDLEKVPELKATIDNLKAQIAEGGENAGKAQLDLDQIQKDPVAYYEKQKADYLKSIEGQGVAKEESDATVNGYDELINKIKGLKAETTTEVKTTAVTPTEVKTTTEEVTPKVEQVATEAKVEAPKEETKVEEQGNDLILSHGTKHDFDRFQLEKIGTGEGAQAFGYGLYFTDGSKIAEGYAKKLSEDGTGLVYSVKIKNGKNANWAEWRLPLDQSIESDFYDKLTDAEKKKYQDYLDKSFEEGINKNYTGAFDDLKPSEEGLIEYPNFNKPSSSGNIYQDLKDAFGQEKATEIFKRAGIDGIKYESKGGYGKENNYVVFNPKSIEIIEKKKPEIAIKTETKVEAPKEEEVIPMEVEGEQPPFVEKGVTPVTLSGLTEEGRQQKIEQRKKETKTTARSVAEGDLLDLVDKYKSLRGGRLGKNAPEGRALENKINVKLAEFNQEYGTDYAFDKRRESIMKRNAKGQYRKVGRKTIGGGEAAIDEKGRLLRDRDDNIRMAFDDLSENNMLPTGYRPDGKRFSAAEIDAIVDDIRNGIPSKRANNYLDQFEKQIKADELDYTTADSPPLHILGPASLKEVLGGVEPGEKVTEPMSQENIDKWLNEEAKLTPENEEVYDNIDNLITQYEHENESKAAVQQPEPTTAGAGAPTPEQVTAKGAKPTEVKPTKTELSTKPKEPVVEPKTAEERKSLADKIRQAKIGGDKAFDATIGLPVAIWDGAVELVATSIEAGMAVADAIKRGVNYIEKNHRGKWDKKAYNDKIVESLGYKGIRVNGEDVIAKPLVDKQSAEVINGFYSPLEQGILDAKVEKATGKEWAKKLEGTTEGDELKFTGMSDFLSQNADKSLTKQEVLDYMKNNRIQIVEVVKGKESPESITDDYQKWLDENGLPQVSMDEIERSGLNNKQKAELKEFESRWNDAEQGIGKGTKYSQYQLPGEKTNYKEVLITLPKEKELPKGFIIKENPAYHENGIAKKYIVLDDKGERYASGDTYQEAKDTFYKNHGEYFGKKQFKSSHFEEPNILAHVRMNTRVDGEGNKVLHIEEFQSDWGQEGKKKGFDISKDIKGDKDKDLIRFIELQDKGNNINNSEALELDNLWQIMSSRYGVPDMGDPNPIQFYKDILKGKKITGIPSAPFVTETANWTKLAWKVALKEAVKEEADKITWTTGEQQNERYDLSKQVDEIGWQKNEDGTYTITPKKSGSVIGQRENMSKITLNRVADLVGKDIAEKIKNEEGKEWQGGNVVQGKLKGEQLTVGGTGMKGFYGSPSEGKLGIVGEVAKSLFKQEPKTTEFGKYEVVGDYNINPIFNTFSEAKKELDTNPRANKIVSKDASIQHSIDITPEMKQGVKEGMAMFKSPFTKLAENIRKGKIGDDVAMGTVPFVKEVWNGAVETVATAVEISGDIKQAIEKGVEYIKGTDWYKNLSTSDKQRAEKAFRDEYSDLMPKEEFKTEHPFLYTGTTEKKVSGFMKHIMESENVSEATKEQFKEKGIKYNAASNEEARSVAVDIVKAFGNQDALKVAEWNEVHPSVRSAIYAELIDGAFQREKNAKTDAERIAAAQEWADLASQYDKQLTAGGQFTAYAGHFYRNSPLGFVLKENQNRQEVFNEWFEGKEKSYEEIFNKILETAEGKELLSKEIDKANKEQRKAERAKRDKQIDDFFNKAKMQGGTYATIIPPSVWNAAVDIMAASVKAGDRVVVAVQKAIEHIDKELKGAAWDKEKFRKEYEEKLTKVADAGKKEKTAEDYAAQLKRRKEELERRMREGDFSAEEYKEKRTLSEKEKAAKEEYDKVKAAYDEAKKQSPEWVNKKAKQFLEQFGNRMKGLTDAQKQDLVIRSIKKIAETGGLRIEEFRKMVAETKGLKDLSPEEVTKIEGLTKKINSQEEAANTMVENPTAENIAAFKKAREESMQASLDLRNLTYKESEPLESIKSILTLNMMGAQTLVKNVFQNLILQATVRFPGGIVKQLAELGTYGTTSLLNKFGLAQVYYPKYNIIEAQKGYFGKAKQNINRAWFNFKHGTQEQDLFSKTSYQTKLAPKQAWKDIKMWRKGEMFLTKKDLIDRAIRITLGPQANFIAKSMSFGDKISRWNAEGAEARNIAVNELKIKDPNQLEAFMVAPQKMAYKIFVDRGESKDVAIKKSTEIEERIINKGNEAVLEQENWLSELSKAADVKLKVKKEDPYLKKLAKPIASLTKVLTFPFVRIPANLYWIMFKMTNPAVSVGQSILQSAEALNYAKKGEPGKAKALYEKSKENMYLAAVGYGIGVAATSLVQAGLVRSGNDDDNKIRETTGERLYGKQNQLDLGKLMGGKSFWVDLNWFGPIGTQVNVKSRLHDERLRAKLKGEPDESGFFNDLVDNITYSAAESLNNLVFESGTKTVNALRDGEGARKTWVINATNAFGNVFTGATYTAISKAMLPEEPRLRGDSWTEEIINNAKQRNILFRMFAGYPPSKVSIWGDPIRQDNSAWGVINNMLGFQKDSRTQFGAILYADYFKTQDPKFFPMPEDNKISVNGEQVEITQSEKAELDKFIGQTRKQYVDAFVYDCVPVNVVRNGEILEVRYNQMTDKEKVEQLQQLYKDAREVGFQKFQEANSKYATAELSPEQMIDKKLKEAFNPVNLMIIKEKAEEKENKK